MPGPLSEDVKEQGWTQVEQREGKCHHPGEGPAVAWIQVMAVEDPEVDTFQISTEITSGLDLFEEKERIKVDSSVWDLNNWVNNGPVFCDGKQQWRENQKFCFVPVRLCCLLDPQGGNVTYTIGYTGEVAVGDRNVKPWGQCDV